jgi:hypothetical protein
LLNENYEKNENAINTFNNNLYNLYNDTKESNYNSITIYNDDKRSQLNNSVVSKDKEQINNTINNNKLIQEVGSTVDSLLIKFTKLNKLNHSLQNECFKHNSQIKDLEKSLIKEKNERMNITKQKDESFNIIKDLKIDLEKAFNEMKQYDELFNSFEQHIKEAKEEKEVAIKKRDEALEQVKEIRKKYILMLGEKE